MEADAIKVVAALIRDGAGRVLLVRKRGTTAFMQPGGKRDPGEDDIAALAREVAEELGCRVDRDSIQPLGEFDAVAANEPGRRVQACLRGRSLGRCRAEPRNRRDDLGRSVHAARHSPGAVDARPCAAAGGATECCDVWVSRWPPSARELLMIC